MTHDIFRFDPTETFPHLDHAPIVEAVIHWRARPRVAFDQSTLRDALCKRLPGYPTVEPQHQVEFGGRIARDGSEINQKQAWLGFRLKSADDAYVVQFNRDGLVFSRLKPYPGWDSFSAEALRLWSLFLELAAPTDVHRLGIRFINRIELRRLEELDETLVSAPAPPAAFPVPVSTFMHKTRFDIPDHPYSLNVVQTVQPPDTDDAPRCGLILDLDVFTTRGIEVDGDPMLEHLRKLRWVKNKAFFAMLKPHVIERFQGE